MTIRPATVGNVVSIVAMMAKFHGAADQPQKFCEKSSAEFITGMINSGHIVLIGKDGFICGFVTPSPVNAGWVLALELFWWSAGSDGVKLMTEFTRIATERGANEIRFSCRVTTPKIESYLKRVGYRHDEQVYKKVI